MKLEIIISIFAVLVLGSIPYTANGQLSDIADHVVINEIDINPPGDDSKTISEWVEIFNPTNEEVDIGGWQIASTTILKKTFTIADGTIIKSGQFFTYSYQSVWFTDLGERVELRDASGNVIDETPTITDLHNDFTSWQRLYDGFGTNSPDDWKFVTSTAGSTNGKIIIGEDGDTSVSISVSSDKTNYLFDETATISGTVSKQIFQEKPFFHQQTVDIVVSGPNYYKTISLYPNMFLEYDTSLKLQKVLGVSGGIYVVSVSYGDVNIETQFSVSDEIFDIQQIEQAALTITTDKESYLPGETATIFAETSEIIPFEGLKFQVINPNGIKIYEGTLFPTTTISAVRGGELNANPDAQFSTTIFIDTVSPTYGIYTIIAQYSTQAAISTFEVTEDVKENKMISLSTDKPAYGLGETVIISGRLNNLYIASLDLEILQTGLALSTDPVGSGSLDPVPLGTLKILDAVRLAGDSTFGYEFTIPNNPDRLGDYRVTVSKDIGQETVFFKVVENPEAFVATSVQFSISTNKVVYDVGDRMVVFGNVADQTARSSFEVPVVSISITTEDGRPLEIIGLPEGGKRLSTSGISVGYEFTGIPDSGGNFRVEAPLTASFFPPGTYQVKAIYDNGKLSTSTLFSVVDPLDIGKLFSLQLNKEVFGFGEKVILEGIVPNVSQGVGITITLIKPDGDTDIFGALADNSRFTWDWETPLYEKKSTVYNERVVSLSNYGIYQVVIKSDAVSKTVFFKVSPNPEEDTLEIAPLQVTTEKAIYNAGETLTVLGSAIKRQQGMEGLVVPDRAKIIISSGKFPFEQIFDSSVYLDTGGNFKSSFVLPVTIFKDGNYKVTAIYQEIRAETMFTVNNEYLIGGDAPLTLLLNTDKDEYALGETVHISGRPSKLVYLENIVVTVIHEDELQITCGSFICGRSGSVSSRVAPSQSGSFTFDYEIPISDDAKGKYEIIADTEFGVYSIFFVVTDKLLIVPGEQEPTSLAKRITEKFNRIPDSFVSISVTEKIFDGVEMLPRVLQGSLLTPVRGEEANVNIKISTEDGTCIIGQESDCLVTDSTRGPGAIYKIVEIDGVNYKVRYSGIDARLEKFTILPESSDGNLLDSTWNVEVIKDDQPSRLYYKITYVLPE
ncbi:MAG: S-layer protein, contains zincin protease domain and Ig-fold domain [Nitrosopumilales archaeon]|nr:MAG: S-layer protein, contains zincin protease domain and Ig-fold domain [Nitrosopumilales archaeon]